MERGRKWNFESFSDIDDGESDSDYDDDGAISIVDDHLIDDNAQLRRKIMSVICGLICVMNDFIVSRNLGAAEVSFLPVAMS